MKKIFFILLPLLSLCFFLAKSSFALDAIISPVASPSASIQNPGPPIGIPCGKTMCLPNETCTTYPSETDPHCVPTPLNPNPTLPPDCEDLLGLGQGSFPMNQTTKCWNHFINAQTDLTLYKKSCIYEPIASYGDKRKLNSGPQPFSQCGKGNSGPNGPAAPGGGDPACDIHMLVNTDVEDAELGSYGPDASAASQFSIDFLSQNYLYNSLFDRPTDLSSVNREAYRTYWRLLPASNQANLRSFVMNMAHENQIENIHFDFTKANGSKDKIDFKSLYNGLSAQVIVFLHWPFTRIGCLTNYPVCPEYAQATKELDDNFSSAYSAFTPLDFDSVRGYIVKKKDDVEQSAYDKYPQLRDTVTFPSEVRLTNVSAESLPYIGAIYQGLLSPKFGMIPALEPQWIADKYSTPGATLISDYKMGNSAQNFPEVKIAHQNFLTQVQDEAAAIFTNPLGWIANKIGSFFNPSTDSLKGYTPNLVDNSRDLIVDQYVNMQSCPMPVSYHLLSPKTAAKSMDVPPDDHHQIITIPGNQLEWSYTPQCHSRDQACSIDLFTGQRVCHLAACVVNAENYIEGDQCCTRAWSVSGIKHGKALTVLNNPKQTDIKQAVAGDDTISFYKMLLPDGSTPIPNAEIDAPIAKNLNTQGNGLATAPNGTGTVLNPAESIMRENNLAQDSIHFLQNCWTVPQDQQNSPRCSYNFSTSLTTQTESICPKVEDSAVDSKFLGSFKANFISLADRWSAKCPGAENNQAEECFNYVASEAKSAGVNPAFALTIWLNESGASNYCNGGDTSQDMGINIRSLYKNLVEQLPIFLRMASTKLCEGMSGFTEPMHGWLSRFQSAAGVCNPADTVATQYYQDVMNTTWSWVSGCSGGGKFGITWPTDMSCP